MNAPAHVIDSMREHLATERARQTVEVLPENWHALNVFLDMTTQWRLLPGNAGLLYLGMDYGALPPVLAARRHDRHAQPLRDVFPKLRVMEGAYRQAMNEEAIRD